MRFRVLGPLAVGGGEVTAVRDRTVLAMLLLRAGHLVPVDDLVAALWDGEPPDTARNQVQKAVSRLRQMLPENLIQSDLVGYRIHVDGGDLDASVFADRVDRARRCAGQDPEEARVLLRAALDLWRGPALIGVDSRVVRRRAAALDEQQATAVEEWADLELALGRERQVLSELTALTAQFPLRERLRAQVMVSLYRLGRQADALAEYRRTRQLLVDELGIEPGAALRQLHEQILTGTLPTPLVAAVGPAVHRASAPAASAGVPRQLPLRPRSFAARTRELAQLDELLRSEADTAVVISAVSGTAGIGKTTLAVHWAHRVAERFPDGQLYVNLRGYGPGEAVMTASEALCGFLTALDVPPQSVPTDLDAQAALYRGQLANRRMLIVLDNAREAAQVRPLLPASPGCVVVITSRSQLTGLVATADAHLVNLDLLSTEESRQVLTARLGQHRIDAEPDAVNRIIAACGHLPLALAIAAARALGRPDLELADLAEDLTNARLDAFTTGDPAADARVVFSWSYRALTPPAARLFRLLGLHPGPDFGSASAASLAGLPPGQTRAAIDELTRSHLVAHCGPDRYGVHDLLHAYARELADHHDSGKAGQDALGRLYEYYLHHAQQAARTLAAHRPGLGDTTPGEAVIVERLSDPDQAQAWLTREHSTLVAAVGHAVACGLDRHAWQVAWAIGYFLERGGWWKEWTDTTLVGLAAANRLDDHNGQALLCDSYGDALKQLGDLEGARRYLRQALMLHEQMGNQRGAARTEFMLGILCLRAGVPAHVPDHARRALAGFTAVGDHVGRAHVLHLVAWYHIEVGDYPQAAALAERSVELFRELGDLRGLAGSLDTLGVAYQCLGDSSAAVRYITQSVERFKRIDDRYHTAACLVHLGDCLRATGDSAGARIAYAESLVLYEQIGHPDAEDPRQRLRELDTYRRPDPRDGYAAGSNPAVPPHQLFRHARAQRRSTCSTSVDSPPRPRLNSDGGR
jgi:DNA-binding SARP family transcriptional activator